MITDAMVAVALDAWYEGSHWKSCGLARYVAAQRADMRAVLAAALAAAWQSIGTAPTDGTRVLVWASSCDGFPGFATITSYHPDAGWCVDEQRKATHWMPLPEPPADGPQAKVSDDA